MRCRRQTEQIVKTQSEEISFTEIKNKITLKIEPWITPIFKLEVCYPIIWLILGVYPGITIFILSDPIYSLTLANLNIDNHTIYLIWERSKNTKTPKLNQENPGTLSLLSFF